MARQDRQDGGVSCQVGDVTRFYTVKAGSVKQLRKKLFENSIVIYKVCGTALVILLFITTALNA